MKTNVYAKCNVLEVEVSDVENKTIQKKLTLKFNNEPDIITENF